MQIQLHRFIAGARPGIAHGHAYRHRIAGADTIGGKTRRTDLERGIAQTITERIKWIAVKVPVRSAVLDIVVVKVRQLCDVAELRRRQLAARVIVSEKNIGDGISLLLASV